LLQKEPVDKTYVRLTIYDGMRVIGTVGSTAVSGQETELVIKTLAQNHGMSFTRKLINSVPRY